ncbi:prepilin-type N-terminal cleavage/methylation domain-containing protein [Methylobacter sp. sgz302048]|uniref:prepilin-type N-terminal cleavage/methylation domain-containing protein n=1 Tax=Methylobacter sp. sgz302048 TaxID=3455945 RepID=UPI003F9EC425
MNKTSPIPVQGFTLIEMTVVLLLITLLASVAIRETNSLSFQVRYEQTQERLERIREAILGNPRQIINGQQAVSGFVADMGRLPGSIKELIQLSSYCSDATKLTKADCENTPDAVWFGRKSYGFCNLNFPNETQCLANSGSWTHLFYGGWNGPYLNISGNPADSDAFTDGWGRPAQGYCSNIIYTNQTTCEANTAVWTPLVSDNNYGWYYATSTNDLLIQSYGKDHVSGGVDYDADYPAPASQPEVKSQDWLIDISGGISINFTKQFGANKFCGFNGPAAATQSACKNAGGTWDGTACTFGQDSCKSVGGKWNSCFFTPSACSATGGSLQARCQFTEKSCNAAGGSGSWNTTNRICLDLPTHQINCENAGGSWNGITNRCNFNESSCTLAGGAWVMDCEFTNATCPTGTAGVTWEDTIKPDSCNFTQTACKTLNGTSVGNDYCYLSHGENVGAKYNLASCDAAGGSWTGKICLNVFYRGSNSSIVNVSSNPISIEENGGYQTIQFNFAISPILIPGGQNAIGIYEYDGDCNLDNPLYPAGRQSPIQVDFHPRTGLPVINW